MENLKSPAYPLINQEGNSIEDREVFMGYTKLEKAALMIAQGAIGELNEPIMREQWISKFAAVCASVAKAVLQECNK